MASLLPHAQSSKISSYPELLAGNCTFIIQRKCDDEGEEKMIWNDAKEENDEMKGDEMREC
jgi:hypothetical protein